MAISGNADWRWEDLQAVRDCGGWLFFNARELIRTARRATPAHSKVRPRPCPCVLRKRLGCCRLVASLGACLHDSVGACRVVTGLGACGAALFNGDGPLKYFPTAPLRPLHTMQSSHANTGCGGALLDMGDLRAACP